MRMAMPDCCKRSSESGCILPAFFAIKLQRYKLGGTDVLKKWQTGIVVLGVVGAVSAMVPGQAQPGDEPPYWASIERDKARTRTGPDIKYQIMWVYQRQNLPVKIIKRHGIWRQIEDPDGTQGWMHARLLSRTRTAIVMDKIREMYAEPNGSSRVLWRLEPGVVGKLGECEKGWCPFDVNGRAGWVRADHIWGTEKL